MKLSEQTISILKNFSNINSGLFFQQGKQIRTVAPSKAILAHANIAEEIPVEFGIYDLNRLLGVLSLIEQPDIEFWFVLAILNMDVRILYFRDIVSVTRCAYLCIKSACSGGV